ncbi:MAG: glycosyltransferase family 39 protein [Chloroflexota bacterium]|nr:glycosyltransferase family 39 protein [Chloroflexota bacterium]
MSALASSADGEILLGRRRKRVGEWALVIGVTALAAALRIFALGDIPPGLYHDEAFNGLDALDVITGQWPVYFAANRGREPLFIYLIAATVGLLGRTPGALRSAAAVCGTLTIPATYLMARAWFNRRVALLSAAVLAITLWHVHLSRIGFRAVVLPLTTALTLWLGARAYRSRHWHNWLLAGLLYGICFYAYLPARFTPVVLAAFALYLLFTGQSRWLWPGAAWFTAGTLVSLIPLGLYTVGHWDVVMGRPGQVSVFNPLINSGDLWGALSHQLANTLGMFFIRGDTIPRHNPPGRPVFGPLMGAMMVLGLVRATLRARRETAPALTLIWVGLMLSPTWLAEDAPHFLRAVGVLPLLVIFPALGMDTAMDWLEQRRRRGWAVVIVCTILAIGLATTGRDYFFHYGTDPQTSYAFEDAATELAAEVNRFVGIGWDGNRLVAREGNPRPGRRVYVDSRLWDEWAAIPFLVPETEMVSRLPTESPAIEGGAGEGTLLLLWHYDGVEQYMDLLPRNARIEAHAGPLTRGDLEDTPYIAYVAYTADPIAGHPAEYMARFGDQITLTDYTIETSDQEWRVQLEWEALASPLENYTVFVHLRDGERVVDQDDGEPARGYYPTKLWRSGDVVVDTHVLKPPKKWGGTPQLVVGLYIWPTMERLEVVTPSGEPLGDELVLPNQ